MWCGVNDPRTTVEGSKSKREGWLWSRGSDTTSCATRAGLRSHHRVYRRGRPKYNAMLRLTLNLSEAIQKTL
jgi:hypothetical protein